jgi:hypothetical protein
MLLGGETGETGSPWRIVTEPRTPASFATHRWYFPGHGKRTRASDGVEFIFGVKIKCECR